MKIFLLLLLISSFLFGVKLTKSGNYVIDDTNKLMWQDTYDNVKLRFTQGEAKEYCESLVLNGFSNWRLPTVENYKTIIDKSRVRQELMINKAFRYILPENYWADDRTWVRNFGLYGYFVFFKSGAIYYQNRSYKKFVRCVRDIK
jgi:hypothetical protein